MRVLFVNKFYYHRGGDCTAVFSTEKLLQEKGHETAIFSVRHPQNIPSPWESYFPKEVGFSFSGTYGKLSAVARLFYSREVAYQFNRMLSDFKPDVVHLHNIHSYISPLVAQMAHKRGIRTVWTLHDYKLICPSYSCLRNGKICEDCFRNKYRVFTGKCMKNSYIASLLAWMEACFWNMKKLSAMTDKFISPSHFLKTKMTEAGYAAEQIEVLHNFMPEKPAPPTGKENYYCYVGRLSTEKGVDTLLEAAEQLPYPLKVIGGGPLLDSYQKKYASAPIEFLGHIQPEKLYPIVQKARILVLPSGCYENNPFSIIEALCLGTPVVGSRIGGIPELIKEGENGLLFRPGDVADLKNKINDGFRHFTDSYDFRIISEHAQNKFGSESFYNKLICIYDR
ncbi:MAG: glycosyltransferase family 4 protein [Tannerella sp.]|jgi:glycosyltransferase involved in cell wall biosynthesis|nr:glycosyltransferase family 4 protein [Tannerella sp.]